MSYCFALTGNARRTLPARSPSRPNRRPRGKGKRRSRASSRKTGIAEVYKRVPGELGRHELALIATSYFQQLGHDSQHRIFKFFAWDEAKTKAVNGGDTDYSQLAKAQINKMTTAENGEITLGFPQARQVLFLVSY